MLILVLHNWNQNSYCTSYILTPLWTNHWCTITKLLQLVETFHIATGNCCATETPNWPASTGQMPPLNYLHIVRYDRRIQSAHNLRVPGMFMLVVTASDTETTNQQNWSTNPATSIQFAGWSKQSLFLGSTTTPFRKTRNYVLSPFSTDFIVNSSRPKAKFQIHLNQTRHIPWTRQRNSCTRTCFVFIVIIKTTTNRTYNCFSRGRSTKSHNNTCTQRARTIPYYSISSPPCFLTKWGGSSLSFLSPYFKYGGFNPFSHPNCLDST